MIGFNESETFLNTSASTPLALRCAVGSSSVVLDDFLVGLDHLVGPFEGAVAGVLRFIPVMSPEGLVGPGPRTLARGRRVDHAA
jgi:hypothetical protein